VRALAACVIATILSACALPAGPAQHSCGPAPNSHVALSGAAAGSPTDLWAVGIQLDLGPAQPLTEHWDGRSWTAVPAPVGLWTISAYLGAVSAAGSLDLWAVGAGKSVGTEDRTLIEHWDGSAWTIIASPNVGERTNHLTALDVLAANDAWAVGFYQQASSLLALTEHWDGKVWSVVPGVNPAAGINSLAAVSGTSPSDVWAVGFRRESDAVLPQALIEHWDGHHWSLVSDVWAIGSYRKNVSCGPDWALIQRWDGKAWHRVPSPHDG